MACGAMSAVILVGNGPLGHHTPQPGGVGWKEYVLGWRLSMQNRSDDGPG
jgi:hypothetical protein